MTFEPYFPDLTISENLKLAAYLSDLEVRRASGEEKERKLPIHVVTVTNATAHDIEVEVYKAENSVMFPAYLDLVEDTYGPLPENEAAALYKLFPGTADTPARKWTPAKLFTGGSVKLYLQGPSEGGAIELKIKEYAFPEVISYPIHAVKDGDTLTVT